MEDKKNKFLCIAIILSSFFIMIGMIVSSAFNRYEIYEGPIRMDKFSGKSYTYSFYSSKWIVISEPNYVTVEQFKEKREKEKTAP